MRLDYPVNWKPRDYQQGVWDYLGNGGRHAELIWHRRAGKDDIALRHAGCEMLTTPANYWHMLPKSNQVRKAIWEAVNPHTGTRRIKEAFPPQLFNYRETDMVVSCKKNASTWQCLGSDNYEGAVGSTPKGIVYSEWALANPAARGYLRPIIAENNGWQIFVGTPRGKNHAYQTFKASQKRKAAYSEILTIHDTGVLSPAQLIEELEEYISTYGEDYGLALYEQEYECSFDSAILGAFYALEFNKIDKEERVRDTKWNPDYPVHVVMDIGRRDDTAMWFFQAYGGQLYILEYFAASGRDPSFYMGVVAGRGCNVDIIDGHCKVSWGDTNDFAEHSLWDIASIWMPHDARAKKFDTLKTGEEQFAAGFGWGKVHIVSNISIQDGINAGRMALNYAQFDEDKTHDGLEALRSYHREWDDSKKIFKQTAEHDWSSHGADAWRYLGVVWSQDRLPAEKAPMKTNLDRSFMNLVESNKRKRLGNE